MVASAPDVHESTAVPLCGDDRRGHCDVRLFWCRGPVGQQSDPGGRNRGESAVQLEITVEREMHRDGGNEVTRRTVFDETVSVGADETETVEVLGDESFRVTVRSGARRLQFGTVPTCDDAFTRGTVADDRDLSATTRDCEGVTREFPRRRLRRSPASSERPVWNHGTDISSWTSSRAWGNA